MDRFVLDASVVRTALCSPDGPSAYVISKALSGDVVLLTSYPLFTEYEALCMTRSMWEPSGLVGWEVADYLDGLAALMRVVSVPVGWLPRLKDVVSEISLLTAVQGDADAIVSLGQPHYGDVCDHYDVALISPQQASERLDHD